MRDYGERRPGLMVGDGKSAEMIRRSVTSSTAIEGVHIKHYKEMLRKHARSVQASGKA